MQSSRPKKRPYISRDDDKKLRQYVKEHEVSHTEIATAVYSLRIKASNPTLSVSKQGVLLELAALADIHVTIERFRTNSDPKRYIHFQARSIYNQIPALTAYFAASTSDQELMLQAVDKKVVDSIQVARPQSTMQPDRLLQILHHCPWLLMRPQAALPQQIAPYVPGRYPQQIPQFTLFAPAATPAEYHAPAMSAPDETHESNQSVKEAMKISRVLN